MGYKLYSNITCPNAAEGVRKIFEKVFITKKYTQCKISHALKTYVFE